jgi:hypothetical protein
MLRRRIAALPAGQDALRAHARTELDGGHEAVAAVAVDALRRLLRRHAERRQRTPVGRREADRDARLAVVVLLVDGAADALEAVDLAPRRLPAAEVGLQFLAGARQRIQAFLRRQPVWMKSTTGTLRLRAARTPPSPCPGPSTRPASRHGIRRPAQVPAAQQRDLLGQPRLQRRRRPAARPNPSPGPAPAARRPSGSCRRPCAIRPSSVRPLRASCSTRSAWTPRAFCGSDHI